MGKYIGTKLIEAVPAYRCIDTGKIFLKSNKSINSYGFDEGYKIKYPDGYESWSLKDVFEKAYMKVIPNSNLKSDISISQDMVNNFIKETHVDTVGDKTTVVRALLKNGFEIVEASACVDKNNYDENIGAEICINKIKDKIWFLLGFLLQTAKNGVK